MQIPWFRGDNINLPIQVDTHTHADGFITLTLLLMLLLLLLRIDVTSIGPFLWAFSVDAAAKDSKRARHSHLINPALIG